jgi:hypothetical protein
MWTSACRAVKRASIAVAAIAPTAIVVLGLPAVGMAAEGAAQDASSPADTQAAVWTPKELLFVYQGFTTKYSCDGLRDKMKSALLKLGAQKKGLQVRESGCSSSVGRPDPFPGVRIKMNVLQPASGAADPKQPVIQARWKPVELKLDDYDTVSSSGECELVDQIRTKILPLFATRDLDYRSDCIPHQASVAGSSLKVSVLAVDPKDQKGAAAIQSGSSPVKP